MYYHHMAMHLRYDILIFFLLALGQFLVIFELGIN